MRIGVGLGAGGPFADARTFGRVVDGLEQAGFDSLWVSERAGSPLPDPLVALAVAAGRTRRLKLGTSVQVLPGRNPVLLAKAWASLAVLSGGRALPAFGLGTVDPLEQQAFGVTRRDRAPWVEEVLPLLRRLWTGEPVDHEGPRFRFAGVRVLPVPPRPLDVWLGGRSPVELARAGRLADGWLPSYTTPAEAAAGRRAVEEAAAGAGRSVDPGHFGALVPYARTAVPAATAALVAKRSPGRDPAEVVAVGTGALRDRLEAFVAHGFSKLVVVPAEPPTDWPAEIATLADALLDLET